MGIDLELLVIEKPGSVARVRSYIDTDRDYDFYNKIRALASHPCTTPMNGHKKRRADYEKEYGEFDEDEYGNPLRYVHAGDFIVDILSGGAHNQPSQFNKAALEYISALPRNTAIVLYWC